MWTFGRLFVRAEPGITLLVGLIISAAVVSVTARFAPIYSKEIIYFFSFFGVCRLIYDLYRRVRLASNFDTSNQCLVNNILIYIAFFVFFLLFFRWFHYSLYTYESHDILYFGPALEIFKAKYFGNIRVPTYYPFELGSYHLLPSFFISIAGFIEPKVTLQYLIEIRYLVVAFFFSSFFYQFYRTFNFNLIWFSATSIASLVVFGSPISLCLSLSSFCYVFVLLFILLEVFKIQNNSHHINVDEHKKILLILSILLVICKAPIFFIAAIFSFYLWIKLKEQRLNWQVLLAVVLVIANMLTWAGIEQSPHVKKYAGSFHIIHNVKDVTALATIIAWFPPPHLYENFIAKVDAWSNEKSIKRYNFHSPHRSIANDAAPASEKRSIVIKFTFYLLYIVFFIYGLFFYIIYKENDHDIYNRSLVLYMSFSMFSWLFVRNGPHQIDQQVHAILLAPTVTSIFLIKFVNQLKNVSIRIAEIFVGIVCFYGFNITMMPSDIRIFREEKKNTLKLEDAELQPMSQSFYHPTSGEPYWKIELQSLMSGLRIRASEDILPFGHVQMIKFVLRVDRKSLCTLDAFKNEKKYCRREVKE